MTLLVMSAIFFFGLLSYQALPVSDLPNVDMPTIQVSVSYPGASPDLMANAVSTPLEQQFMTIEGIQTIFSSSSTGSSSIILQFALDRDIDAASTDVQAAISRAQPYLPSNLPNQPTYEKVNPAATPILWFGLISPNMTLGELYDYANIFIGKRLSMIDGVAQVSPYGSPYAVRIQVDPEKLAAKNIGLDQVTSLIQAGNVDLPLGTLYGNREDYTIEADGQMLSAPPYSELIIKNASGDLVKIKDVGRSLDSIQNDKTFMKKYTREGAHQAVFLSVQRLPGKNTVEIIQKVDKVLEELKAQLPQNLTLFKTYDQSDSIIEGVRDVKITLLVAFLLVVAIIYVLLGKALNTIIPTLALPLSILGTFGIMYLLGFSLDILSLLALTLSIGFLVDDAIVVLENIVRHVQAGEKPFDAALKATREISVTVLSMTLCLISAFIPMLFMGGVIGKLFREFAVTIIVAVLISGFVSLTLTPMLASRFVRPYEKGEKKPRMEEWADAINEKLKRIYEPLLRLAMKHRFWMLFCGLFSIVASIFLYKQVPTDFLPPDDVGYIQGYTQSRDGTSPFLMNHYHDDLAKIALQDPNVDYVLSISSYSNSNQGILFIRLKPFKERLPVGEVIQGLTQKLNVKAGINTYLSPLPLINLSVGTTSQALYQYSMTSIDSKTLFSYAPKLTNRMQNNPLFSQVSSDLLDKQPQWNFKILRDKASNYNVTASAIENYLQWAYSDNKISQINGEINEYDVIVETLPRFYRDPSVLSKLYVSSLTGAQVPLSELVEATESTGPLTVNHINGLPAVTISFNPGNDIPLGEVLGEIQSLTKQDFPPQIQGQVVGTAQIFADSFNSLNFLMIIAFAVIYLVLGILYESFIHPLTVMSALPPTLFGGLLTLYVFQETLSVYSFVGLILLIGIVLKNGIMMVDFANEAVRNEHKSAHDAIIEAALVRFRPILMTTISALMGAVPIALGVGGAMARNRISLGLCIVGGLLVSQVLTLLLTPVLYYYFEVMQEKFWNLFQKKKDSI
jgi:HAE1 family hydrophobic/amphiphilic exporter-1